MANHRVLKGLMLGLIYPAVLGTVIYTALAATLAPRVAIFAGRAVGPTDPYISIKAALLAITIAFYICDYLYIMFTREFGWLFFGFDIAFLATLYVTVYAIDLSPGSTAPPHFPTVVCCFVVFMALYLVWDLIERHRSPTPAERQWYLRVLGWEVISLVALTAVMIWDLSLLWAGTLVIGTLTVVTCTFWVLTIQKRRFATPDQRGA